MKSIPQLVKETGIDSEKIRHTIVTYGIKKELHNRVSYICSESENKLHQLLHSIYRMEYIILESKINKN